MMETVLKRMTIKSSLNDMRLFIIASLLAAVIIVLLALITTPYMTIATVAYLLLLSGLLFRRQRRLHISFMSVGVMTDLTLVLILEINRSAVASAIGGNLNFWQMGHILFSLLAVILYLPTIYFGIRAAWKKNLTSKPKAHLYLGRAAFIFRTVGFFLMFSLLEYVKKHHSTTF